MKTKTLGYLTCGMLLMAGNACPAETAMVGWWAIPTSVDEPPVPQPQYVQRLRMDGPAETNGVFKGSFQWQAAWKPELVSVLRLAVDASGKVEPHPVAFRIIETAEASGAETRRTMFETESLTFAEGECFLLVFRVKGETHLRLLRISRKFIPH